MKLCTETITVVRVRWDAERGANTYTPLVLRGVSWRQENLVTVDPDKGLKAAVKTTVRIPAGAVTGALDLVPGDLIIHGRLEPGADLTAAALIRAGGVTALGVIDNRAGRAPHWKVTAS